MGRELSTTAKARRATTDETERVKMPPFPIRPAMAHYAPYKLAASMPQCRLHSTWHVASSLLSQRGFQLPASIPVPTVIEGEVVGVNADVQLHLRYKGQPLGQTTFDIPSWQSAVQAGEVSVKTP